MEPYLNPFLNKSLALDTTGTVVEYECPLAQKFDQVYMNVNLTCGWDGAWNTTTDNGTWIATNELAPCIRKFSKRVVAEVEKCLPRKLVLCF